MPGSQKQSQSNLDKWDGNIQNLPCIGTGISGLVFEIDEKRVAKVALGTARSIEDIEIERRIYRRFRQKLPDYDLYVLFCLETDNPRGLVFEKCQESVRSRLRSRSSLPLEEVMKWAKQAAKGLAVVHGCRVIQGDVGCHNMLLDAKDDLKLADFAGSSIDGSEASVNYEVRSRLPGISKPTEKSDIFALGSALFELATGSPPYSGESNKAVQNLYKKLKFADVSMLPELGPIIKKCWRQGYGTTVEVVEALDRLESYGSTQKALHLEAPVVNSATPALDTPDISRLEIKKSTSRRDREVSPTYVLHASRRRSAHRRGNYTETATEKRRQRRKHSRPTFIHKFIMPWLSPIQKET